MYHVRFDLPKQQWQRIIAAARQTWPDEKLTDAELLRRCVILDVRTLPYLSADAARQFVEVYRNYQPPFDGDRRLTIHDEWEEGDPLARIKIRSQSASGGKFRSQTIDAGAPVFRGWLRK